MPKITHVLLALCAMCETSIALAADAAIPDDLGLLQSWPQAGKVLAFVLALQVFLRGLAEGLTRISDFTDNTWDNKAAAMLSEVAWFLGSILGKVGYGEPTLVSKAKIEQGTAEKEVAEMTARGS